MNKTLISIGWVPLSTVRQCRWVMTPTCREKYYSRSSAYCQRPLNKCGRSHFTYAATESGNYGNFWQWQHHYRTMVYRKPGADHSKGIIVLDRTQCDGGSVELGRYETSTSLQQIRVTNGNDMTYEASITKLMFLLRQDLHEPEVKKMLETSLKGELTEK